MWLRLQETRESAASGLEMSRRLGAKSPSASVPPGHGMTASPTGLGPPGICPLSLCADPGFPFSLPGSFSTLNSEKGRVLGDKSLPACCLPLPWWKADVPKPGFHGFPSAHAPEDQASYFFRETAWCRHKSSQSVMGTHPYPGDLSSIPEVGGEEPAPES